MSEQVPEAPAEDVPAESTDKSESAEIVEGEKALGDAGKQALDRMKQERNEAKAAAKAEREAREALQIEVEKLKNNGEEDKAAKAIREAEAAATQKANLRIASAELRAAATGKLADPADALAFIDPKSIEVNDSGEVDAEAVAAAITDLLSKKPHLAAQGKRFQGSGDGGARPSTPKRAASIEEAIAAKIAEQRA
jgi:hypothetical protein